MDTNNIIQPTEAVLTVNLPIYNSCERANLVFAIKCNFYREENHIPKRAICLHSRKKNLTDVATEVIDLNARQ